MAEAGRLRAFVGGSDGSTGQFTFAAVECVAGGGDAGHGCVAGRDHTAYKIINNKQ